MARDPARRRQQIIDAAAELVSEVGAGRVTHRAIADRAGIPLGSTTYYFPTLDSLIGAVMDDSLARLTADLDDLEKVLDGASDPAVALAEWANRCLQDPLHLLIDYELYLAAVRDPELRPLALTWMQRVRELVARVAEPELVGPVFALLEGAMLQALVLRSEIDVAELANALRRLVLSSPGPSSEPAR